MKIGICLRKSAYLPEAYAYTDFLNSHGFKVELGFEDELSLNLDLKLKFLGFSFPLPSKLIKSRMPEIHEYGSLSIPPFAKVKDIFKRTINTKPVGRIFLNNVVKQNLNFLDNKPFIFRDMGIDSSFFKQKIEKPEYDVIYCGGEREGLLNAIKKLNYINLKVLIVGDFSNSFRSNFPDKRTTAFTGRMNRKHLPELYQSCRFGLNFTPDIYPFNIQTSTKTLEYCAAGLGIISNRYHWVEEFMSSRNGNFSWIDQILSRKNIENFNFITPDVSDLEWNIVLEKSSIKTFVESFSTIY